LGVVAVADVVVVAADGVVAADELSRCVGDGGQAPAGVCAVRVRYGVRWRREASVDVLWMLRTGPFVDEACTRVEAMISDDGRDDADLWGDTQDDVAFDAEGGARDDQFAEVVRINERQWERCGRAVSAETVRKQLRVGADRARAMTRAVRASDAAAITRKVFVAVE
jgi:hypothetical protein